jgi:uncharacterized protein
MDFGLLTPFRRDRKNDFASGTGDEVLKSQVIQVLMIEGDTPKSSGELPWRTSFGSAVHLARHHRNDAVISELVRVYARDALKKWMPGVTVTRLDVQQDQAALNLRVGFRGPDQSEQEAFLDTQFGSS